ncbi:MAG: sugar phosphate isomerase/epimerase family protein [Armatimonadota bacterium]
MKLAFSTLGCPQWSLDQIIEAARACGYEGVELRCYRGSLDLLEALSQFPGGPAEFRRRLGRAGIEVCCLDTSIQLADPDESVPDGDRMIDLAMALGAPYLRVFGGEIPSGESRESCVARAAGKLARLGKRAAQRGKRVLVETHDAFSTGASVAALLQAAGSEGVGVLWDLHHPYRMGEAPEKTAGLIARSTYHAHVKDSKDGGYKFLGEGDIPLDELVSKLHSAGYAGYLCLEWEKQWHPELPEPEVAFPQAAGYLSDLLAGLGIRRG